MLDPKRANACTAIIAGGHVVVIDAGPGAWAKLAQAMVPAAQVDTVLLTHLHSDHLGDLGEVAVQSWIGGRKVGRRRGGHGLRQRRAQDRGLSRQPRPGRAGLRLPQSRIKGAPLSSAAIRERCRTWCASRATPTCWSTRRLTRRWSS
ncbi:MAG: MBL fold metallo-hydrolase [Hyphomicrobiaceae bacterium]|nr:MAG: MBL fold metallo-hydrolase [Hyphomicrobiaceae bacterium]